MADLDRRLFESLVRAHHGAVYRTARRVVRCDADAEDVAQRVFLHVLRVGEGFDDTARAQRSLCWLAARFALNSLRDARRRHSNERSTPVREPSATPLDLATERELLTTLTAELAGLPDELRLPLVLRFQEGLSYGRVGHALDVPESTVHERVHRGLDRLRDALVRAGVVLPATRLQTLCGVVGGVTVPPHLEERLLSLQPPVSSPVLPGGVLATVGLSGVVLLGTLLAPRHAVAPPVASCGGANAVAAAEKVVTREVHAPRELVSAVALAGFAGAARQDPRPRGAVRVPLRVEATEPSGIMVAAVVRGPDGPLRGRMLEGVSYEIDFGGVPTLRVTGLAPETGRFALRVDTDDDGDFEGEERRDLEFGGSTEAVFVKRRGDGVKGAITVRLHASRDDGGDSFTVRAGYAAVGTLEVGDASASLQLSDVDGNGYFDARDAFRGTTLRIDLDGDGAFASAGEIASLQNLFELGGQTLGWGELARDGTWVDVERAAGSIPRLGRPLPPVELRTVADQPVELAGRDRPLLIALWASWCTPCIKKMPVVQALAERYGSDLLYYSVDRAEDVDRALEIARRQGFGGDRMVAEGRGARDPLWTMINSMHGGSIGVPKFALLDRDGVLRYAGADLENLEDALRAPDRTSVAALLEDPKTSDVSVKLRHHAGSLRFLDREVTVHLQGVDGEDVEAGDDRVAGLTLLIDRDGDGRFHGPAELLPLDQPFELGGGDLEFASLSNVGRRLRFRRSGVDVPVVGRKLAGYVFRRRGGKLVFLGNVQRPTALVFWSAANAESLAAVDALLRSNALAGGDVYLLCIDGKGALEASFAEAIERGWPKDQLGPSAAGGADFVYRACAGMPTTGRTTPLFVVLDGRGVVRTATTNPDEVAWPP